MFANTGSQGRGVGRRVPVMRRRVVFSFTSTRWVCADWNQTGQQYSATEKQRASADVRRVFALAPHVEPASFISRLFRLASFLAVFVRCSL